MSLLREPGEAIEVLPVPPQPLSLLIQGPVSPIVVVMLAISVVGWWLPLRRIKAVRGRWLLNPPPRAVTRPTNRQGERLFHFLNRCPAVGKADGPPLATPVPTPGK